jgi:hypothetical protein
MAIIVTGNIPALLRPGLEEVGLEYGRYKGEYKEVFTEFRSEKNFEQDVEMRQTGYALEKSQGAPIEMDSMGQRFIYNFFHRQFALGFQISDIAREDDLYMNEFYNGTKTLTNSYEQTREVMAMNVFNQAFNPVVPIGDGQPLCSAAHPIDGGTYSNLVGGGLANVDFSEAGVEAMIILAGQLKDQAGLLIKGSIEKLLLPQELQFSGCRLLESTFRTGTANNDINAVYNMKAIPQGYVMNHYLVSSSNWFGLTNIKNTRKHFVRTPFKMAVSTDPITGTMTTTGSGRYSFGVFTPLGVIGAQGN